MRKWRGLLAYLLVLILIGSALFYGVLVLASSHAKELVGLLLGGYERFTLTQTSTTLKRLANLPSVQRMDSKSCANFGQEIQLAEGFFAVLAIGDKNGSPVCSDTQNDPSALPTMADRTYYQRVRDSQKMVVGEYAVSKTTGKQVLHLAYPINSVDGSFVGFILAGVNLEWFVNPEVDKYMGSKGVEVLGVDDRGRVLYTYPADIAKIGETVVSAEMVGAMFGNAKGIHVMRGHDGEYKVYEHKVVPGSENKQMLFLVGVSAWNFAPIALGVFGLMTICALVGWYWAGVILPVSRKSVPKKK